MNFDQQTVLTLYNLVAGSPTIASLDVLLATWGIFAIPGVLALAAIWPGPYLRERRQILFAAAISFVLAYALSTVISHLIVRPRPFIVLRLTPLFPHDSSSSFPSDHTILGTALAWPIVFRWPRRGLFLVLWALAVGFARVTAGVHYPTDILGSAALALVAAGVGFVLGAWFLLESRLLRSLVYLGV